MTPNRVSLDGQAPQRAGCSRWVRVGLILVAAVAAAGQPRSASAWHHGRRAAHCGFGHRPFCPPAYGLGYGFGYGLGYGAGFGGWGFGGWGVSSYRSFSYWTPGFYSGWSYPCVSYASPYGYGYGCGWYPYSPVLFAPAWNCYPSSFAPAFGPAGVVPFMRFGATNTPVADVRHVAARPTQPPAAAPGMADLPRVAAIRASNAGSRLRAGKLLATGDQHLRAAVNAPAELAAALDAYRRAATIAPDQPDTFLRQAIVLTALGRDADAQAAVARAVAIDARLGDDAVAAVAAADRLPPDPVFGDAPAGGPTALASRSASLLGRIFRSGPADEGAEGNWIAARWSRQWQERVNVIARR